MISDNRTAERKTPKWAPSQTEDYRNEEECLFKKMSVSVKISLHVRYIQSMLHHINAIVKNNYQ
jgi:hypothetical protein